MRLHLVYLSAALCSAALLSGCKDDNIIRAGLQLSADGKAAAVAYSEFMATSADLSVAGCEIASFEQMLMVRKSGLPAADWARNAQDCQALKASDREYKGLMQWSSDGRAVAKAYAALARLTSDGNADSLKKALDTTSHDIADAAGTALDPRVSAALGSLSGAVVHLKEADGIVRFAQAMKGVPEAMLATLTGGQRPDYYKVLYTQYDKAVASARQRAYEAGVVDGLAGADQFTARLGLVLNLPNHSDPYVAAFSRQYQVLPSAAERGLAARDQLIDSLKALSAETDQVIQMQTASPTLREDLADLRQTIKTFNDIAHAK